MICAFKLLQLEALPTVDSINKFLTQTGGVVPVVEHLPSKHRALSLNPNTIHTHKNRFLILSSRE
jgi:hypothetical protein